MTGLKISVVIRVRNEVDNLAHLLALLRQQIGVDLEVVVVDNGSTDGSRKLAANRADHVIDLPADEFSYPLASNLGVAASTHPLVCLMSAHSFPMRLDWLANGAKYFSDSQVAGVYCRPVARMDTTWADRVIGIATRVAYRFKPVCFETEYTFGQFGSTNCMFRRELWEQHLFDLKYGSGAEDGEWARWATGKGYMIVNDPAFAVWHSHGLGPIGWLRQIQEWKGMTGQPFDPTAIAYRRTKLNRPSRR